MNYVNGFMINRDTEEVLLLEKQRPAFQKGKWNGIGGKMDIPGEPALHAQIREFHEEAGIITTPESWEHVCTVVGGNDVAQPGQSYNIYFFRNMVEKFPDFVSMTDEPVKLWKLADIYHLPMWRSTHLPTLPNMRVILPLCFSSTIELPVLFKNVDQS